MIFLNRKLKLVSTNCIDTINTMNMYVKYGLNACMWFFIVLFEVDFRSLQHSDSSRQINESMTD
jgi:hypothetical protein